MLRVTLDYPAGMSWRQEAPLDDRDLDQVGLTLARAGTRVTVAEVLRKEDRPAAPGVRRGDRIQAVDSRGNGAGSRSSARDRPSTSRRR